MRIPKRMLTHLVRGQSWGAASGYVTVVVYMFGLLCWYFMMLDGYGAPVTEYYRATEQEEKEEKKQAEEFSKRIEESEEHEA